MKEAVNTYHPMMGRVFADEENKVLGLCSGLVFSQVGFEVPLVSNDY